MPFNTDILKKQGILKGFFGEGSGYKWNHDKWKLKWIVGQIQLFIQRSVIIIGFNLCDQGPVIGYESNTEISFGGYLLGFPQTLLVRF